MRLIVKLLFVALLLFPIAFAQSADWVEFDLVSNWQRSQVGFCKTSSQCLVDNSFNETFDNLPAAYWDGLRFPSQGPKCIDSGQFILDKFCSQGNWTSRTALLAQQLVALALRESPDNFSLYCDTPFNALHRLNYSTTFGYVPGYFDNSCIQTGFFGAINSRGCVNNACVLQFGNRIAFGLSLNSNIDSPNSFLHALNLPVDSCQNAINDDGDYDSCAGSVWYNWNLNSLIYAPGVSALPGIDSTSLLFFSRPHELLRRYVFDYVHSPGVREFDYSFFNATPLFDFVYIAKKGLGLSYGFKEENVTLSQIDYAGWYYSNIDFPAGTCERFIKNADPSVRSHCKVQPSDSEYYIVAHKTPPLGTFSRQSLVDLWPDLTGKLRVKV
ncbi:hypothetical protein D6825_02445 [Candidatus Woesearchaeota archaeon]|nr:MAG: hypothetical protein D6825_02445 [Candidatus Woesearchaeota archaeon]